jgi:hypothetical protein
MTLDRLLPNGPVKTFVLAMWVNVAVTRDADGTSRNDFLP